MRKTYKDIPKELRRNYNKAINTSLRRAIYGYLIFNRLYKQRHELFDMGRVEDNLDLPLGHDYWRVNNTETVNGKDGNPLSYIRCWYGDKKFRDSKNFDYKNASKRQKKRHARKWWVRNNDWNNKTRIGLKFAPGFDIETKLVNTGLNENGNPYNITTWRNKTTVGEQSVILKLKGTDELYFRYSYTVPMNWWNPLRWFGYKWSNKMRGVETRYLYKNRIWKK